MTIILENCEVCKNCPDDWACCKNLKIPMTIEECKLDIIQRCDKEGDSSFVQLKENGECFHFDPETCTCTIYENRPIACRNGFCKNMPEYKDGTLQKRLIQQQLEEREGRAL